MLAKEMLAHELAVVGFVGLVFTVDSLFHDLAQDAFFVACQQRIPITAPDHFDYIPTASSEIALQLLDDFSVASHRTI